MVTLERILYEMQKHYLENESVHSVDYDYGYMDALAVIRDLQSEERVYE